MRRTLPIAAVLLFAACSALPPPTAETCATRSLPAVPRLSIPASETVRLLLLGDSGEPNQVSATIFEAAGSFHPDAILLLGDNFYECGLDSPERWRDYEALKKHGIPIFPVLGNHDHGCPYGSADPAPQVIDDGVWRLPARNYSVNFGGLAEILFLDTTPVAEAWRDSDDVLCLARAQTGMEHRLQPVPRWRLVAGHHPLYGSGGHAIQFWSEPRRMRALRPILEQGDVSAYLAGHDHHLELVEKNGIAHVLSGSASRLRTALPIRRSRFREARHGFAELEITNDAMRVRFHRLDGTRCCDATEWFVLAQ